MTDKFPWQKAAAIAGIAGFALIAAEKFGIFGGVEGGAGSSKKGTVTTGTTGITPTEWDVGLASSIPSTFEQPINPLEQLAASLQLTNLQLFPQTSGEIKYSGIRETGSTKKEIEGTFRPDLFGQMNIDPHTLQLYYGNPGDKVVLYTEGSRDVPTTKKQSSSRSRSGSGSSSVSYTAVGTSTTKKDTSTVRSQTGAPEYHW